MGTSFGRSMTSGSVNVEWSSHRWDAAHMHDDSWNTRGMMLRAYAHRLIPSSPGDMGSKRSERLSLANSATMVEIDVPGSILALSGQNENRS